MKRDSLNKKPEKRLVESDELRNPARSFPGPKSHDGISDSDSLFTQNLFPLFR